MRVEVFHQLLGPSSVVLPVAIVLGDVHVLVLDLTSRHVLSPHPVNLHAGLKGGKGFVIVAVCLYVDSVQKLMHVPVKVRASLLKNKLRG